MSIKMSLDHNKKEKIMSDAAVNIFNRAGIAVYSEKMNPAQIQQEIYQEQVLIRNIL